MRSDHSTPKTKSRNLLDLLDWILPLNNPNEEHYDSHDKKNVDEPTYSINTDHTEKPKNEKNDCDCYKHTINVLNVKWHG